MPEAIQNRLKLVDSTLSDPELVVQNEYVLKPLASLSRVAAMLDCTVEIKIPHSKERLVAIGPNTYEQVTRTIFIQGNTSITGRLEGVGGATRFSCKIRVPFQSQLFYCEVVSDAVVRKMAPHLFANVTLGGHATWFRGSWKLHRFTVESVQDIKRSSYDEIMNGFKEIGVSEELAPMNIDKFMAEQRSVG
jgi:hypothetical protein